MARVRTALPHRTKLALLFAFGSSACNSLTKLDSYTIGSDTTSQDPVVCQSNARCTEEATAGASEPVPSVCVKSSGECVKLLSADCDTVTGDYLDDESIVLGSLFSTKGAQAATNIQRQQSAMLAVSQIN
ncbi:MAG TPA: hypothetical protein VFZ53_10465, partial [Polyangiaceae bacterium]